MTTQSDTARLNIEYYRKHAKALLKAAESGDPDAIRRFDSAARRLSVGQPIVQTPFALHEAQLVVSREQGFPSWPKFKAFIEQSALDLRKLSELFVREALVDARRAEETLDRHPQIANAGLYPALVLGAWAGVSVALTEAPELASLKGGPLDREPLLYVCFSRFGKRGSENAVGIARTAELLLRYGADANSSYIDKNWPDNPQLSCLYGASGLNNNPELARVLIEAGAQVDDNESLYHSTEHPDLECLKLLLANGAKVNGTNALKHMLDREDAEGLRLLLAAGGDPNETNGHGETALHWAVFRRRSVDAVTQLLDHGAQIDARRMDGRTAYAMAFQSGQTSVATLLAARGADTELSLLDQVVGDFASAQSATELERAAEKLRSVEQTSKGEMDSLLPKLAQSRSTLAVRALLIAGASVDAIGEYGEMALHWACWKGYDDLAKLLLESGASLKVQDSMYHATPTGWFLHGLSNNPDQDGNYAGVARLLCSVGAVFTERDLPTGNGAVDAVLREAGMLK